MRESRNNLAMGVKKSTKRVRGENIDSTTLCTPFEKTGMSSKTLAKKEISLDQGEEKKKKSPKRGGKGQ